MTGTSNDRATRSAVRCRVPVSDVAIAGLGTRWTLARAIRLESAARIIAPSIFASSESLGGLNSASSRKPPEQMERTSGPSPTTIKAPMLAWSMRSKPFTEGPSRGDRSQHLDHRRAQPVRHRSMLTHSPGPRGHAAPARGATGPGTIPRSGAGSEPLARRPRASRKAQPLGRWQKTGWPPPR